MTTTPSGRRTAPSKNPNRRAPSLGRRRVVGASCAARVVRRGESPALVAVRDTMEHSPVGMIVVDRAGNLHGANPAAARILGRPVGQVTPADVAPLVRDARPAPDAAAGEPRWQAPRRLRRADGTTAWVQTAASAAGRGRTARIVVWVQDTSAQRAREEHLVRSALRDPVTGLPNRRLLEQRLELELDRARTEGRPLAVFFVDADRFKDVNDTLGHHAGDALLTTLAARLSLAVRRSDLVARIGGDEFVILCPDTDEAAAYRLQDRLTTLTTVQLDAGSRRLRATVSVGFTTTVGDEPAAAVLARADGAMYVTKHAARAHHHPVQRAQLREVS